MYSTANSYKIVCVNEAGWKTDKKICSLNRDDTVFILVIFRNIDRDVLFVFLYLIEVE